MTLSVRPHERCRACGGTLDAAFYKTGPVPVHSCLMLDDATSARRFPTGTVSLAACRDCGTITNSDFDPRWSAYDPSYEDQQHFSPTFNSFAGKLARDLVHRHGLHGAQVIDVGCSKGDFLALLCEAGVRSGIGIDPSVVEGRVARPRHGRLAFHAEYYGEDHLALPARLISCRHTLEHIHDVGATLRLMHRHAVAAGAATVFIEVPNMTRVLQDCAFEDIYYEHCTYFTPGSLARALRAAGFGVTALWLDYEDQYLLAEASPDPGKDRQFEIEDSTPETLARVADFSKAIKDHLHAWHALMREMGTKGKSVAIWGSGSKCTAFLHALAFPDAVKTIIDINPHRQGRFSPGIGLPISAPSDLPATGCDIVLVMNPVYRSEIAASCRRLGLSVDLLALGDDVSGRGLHADAAAVSDAETDRALRKNQ